MNYENITPVILFVYNRPDHTLETLNKLSLNRNIQDVKLFIFSDAPKRKEDEKNVEAVRNIINNFSWPGDSMEIILRDKNLGLGKSVIDGVSRVINEFGVVVVLEDDIVTNHTFMDYMKCMLKTYSDSKDVYSISGYVIPPLSYKSCEETYFVPRISSWGWATWKNRWNNVDWDISDYSSFIKNPKKTKEFSLAGNDMIDMLVNQVEGEAESWAIRFDYNRYKNNGLTIYPGSSLVSNIGSDGSGAHRDDTKKFDVDYKSNDFDVNEFKPKNILIDRNATLTFKEFYSSSFLSKVIITLRRLGLYNITVPYVKKIVRAFK